MAEIYRAKTFGAAGFEKEFAVKLILPSLVDDKEFVEMFINEAKIAVSLYHANVVQVFDLGEMDTQYYIAMEYVHGMDLLDVLARCAGADLKVPLDLVLFITMEFLKGLDFAHRAKNSYGEDLNIIHRDVSPSNVLMSYAGDVKIGDFGVAKAAVQRNLTESGTLKGKVGYMSPEQVVGDEIDQRSDIFSAGIVFFEALSMSRLFVGNSDLDVMLRVRDADIEDSIRKAQPLPSQLEEIVRTALSKHREERYQTAGEFYQALVDFCFQHRIQVNGSHLSNFMRRLFAEEIEREKNRRIDIDNSSEKLRALIEEKEAQRLIEQSAAFASSDAESIDELSDQQRKELDDLASRKYRYRDASGLVYGPMGYKTIVALFNERIPRSDDRVSIDGGNWTTPFEMDEFSECLDEPSETDASDSVPVGAAVYKPAKREVGAESTVREPTDAELPDIEEGEKELGDTSSPVVRSAPKATTPETAEEAKEVIRELRAQYAAYEGDFHKLSFARLMARLHRTASTGKLQVIRGDIEKEIYFANGEPILVNSNKKEELLGFFLRKQNIITQEQLDEGLARVSEWGGRLGDALVATGAIPAHEIFQHLSNQMREKILDVFMWETGTYGYFENQEPSTHGYPLGIEAYALITEGCLERIPIQIIRNFYSKRRNIPMHRRESEYISVEELRLTSKALRVLKKWNSGDALKTLLSRLPDDERDYIYRVVYLLHQVELFTFEVTESHDQPGPDLVL